MERIMKKTVKAYAKINLHLDVTGIRDDGYHSVETVMQSLSLCDDVSVSLTEDGVISCACNIDGLPTDERNIAVRAARLYLDAIKSDKGAFIRIEKRIPMAAGLAGGSADAAATLVALNELFDNSLSESELLALGASLGADVPFCISCGTHY
jgi:4-diphosphocytidyl-2-C-methyl-D-erythritol kinase